MTLTEQLESTASELVSQPLAAGKDFTCSGVPEECHPVSSAAKQAFSELQRQVSRFSSSLAVDGILGKNTLAAVKTVAEYILGKYTVPTSLMQIYRDTAYATGLGNISARAKLLAATFKLYADDLKLAAAKIETPASSSSSGDELLPLTPPESKSNTIWWIVAGAAVIAAASVGVIIYKRRKRG